MTWREVVLGKLKIFDTDVELISNKTEWEKIIHVANLN